MSFCKTLCAYALKHRDPKSKISVMAIYSLNHKSIGKMKDPPGRAGAHIRYIARQSVAPELMSEYIPSSSTGARKWFRDLEKTVRKNGRLCDCIMVALPRELNRKQRGDLVRVFVRQLGNGVVPWFAAIHQEGKDEGNPHAHIVIHDKSVIDGRRVACLSSMGSTTKIREKWSQIANMRLTEAFYSSGLDLPHIDHRSYKDREICQIPGRHRGPKFTAKNTVKFEPGF